jgi:hypothetical protein
MSVHRVVPVSNIDYPDGPLADALEAEVAATLPPLAGLQEASTLEQRMAIYAKAIEAQREAFIETHGCQFGWEKRSAPREESAGVPAARLLLPARAN